MKRKKSTPEQIVKKLRQAQVEIAKGATVEQVSRKLGITEQTYYRWKREYGGMEVDQLGRLKEPRARERPAEEDRCRAGDGHRRAEGHRLKKMVSPRGRRRAVEYLRTQHYRSVEPAGLSVNLDRHNATVGSHQARSRRKFESAFFVSHGSSRVTVIAGSRPSCGAKDGW